MKKRSIPLMVVLFIITLGIYSLIWYCSFQGELKAKTGEGFGWVAHLFISILTLGIYTIYWNYAAGKRLAKLGAPDSSVLYLVLTIFGFGFIGYFIMQYDANHL